MFLFLDPKGYLLRWGHFEVIAFTQLDFGTEQDPASGHHPGGAGEALPPVAQPRSPWNHGYLVVNPCSAASEARQRIVKWQRRPTIWTFR
jgi:hypothetical protein